MTKIDIIICKGNLFRASEYEMRIIDRIPVYQYARCGGIHGVSGMRDCIRREDTGYIAAGKEEEFLDKIRKIYPTDEYQINVTLI